ncbi:hypothetical protein [Mucilaginibacter arboris]|uniref:Uncharacterized protein n=1 Tax=Mucilaginibacter arboris TaxID=2682090 RepID=A0A7K1SXY8_9SPHI|nr:hypothetical protein [Mucilaginibacter arboris]MVN22182.1 hypothetical protein [Mucilaginibacter arboris]
MDISRTFYFIKNTEGNYIGIVYNMNGDLHWLILPNYRGKGLLTNALSKTILPHIFQDNRKEQRITIDRERIGDLYYLASLKVALAVGFTIKENNARRTELTIERSKFEKVPFIDGINTSLSDNRKNKIVDKAREITFELFKITSELEMKKGFTYEVEEVKTIAESVKKATDIIYDICWYIKKSNQDIA